VRRLEELLGAEGYPDLAYALADRQSLILPASDHGLRDRAMSIPVGTGLVNNGLSRQQRDLAQGRLMPATS
jgi:hypothetical protein